MTKCPKCKSSDIEFIDYSGLKFIKCNKCNFDESSEYEMHPGARETQREKTRFSPYKKGGKGRVRKK